MGYVSRVIRRLKVHFVNWLLQDVPVRQLRVIDLKVGEHTVKIHTDHIDVSGGIQIHQTYIDVDGGMQIHPTYIDGKGNSVIKNIGGLQLPVGTDKYVT